MDEKGFENTQPTRQNPAAMTPREDQGEIVPDIQSNSTDSKASSNDAGLDNTMPTSVGSGDRSYSKSMDVPGDSSFEDTMPIDIDASSTTHSSPTASDIPEKPGKSRTSSFARRRSLSWLVFPVLGLIALGIIAMLSGLGGYFSGISIRRNAENTQVAMVVEEQFQLGLQEMEQGEFHRAQQRFEYVIQLNPNYPGVADKLSEVLLQLNTTATPTLLPTSTITPTPDTRGSQELFDQSQQLLLNKEWKNAIDTLLSLRKADPTFRTVDVDGMLFLALRNQGADKILQEADLEGGIYDLTLASHFGPLDSEAQGFLNWTGLYITGASFWDIDWEQAVNYFSQVAPQLPNLRDGSGMTATERLRMALFEYGNFTARQGQYCKALQLYQQSLAIAVDSQVEEAAALAEKGCSGGGGSQPAKTPKPGKKTPVP